MVLVTLVGEKLVKPGTEFIFSGSLPECRDCRLKGVCFNLEEGRRYRVSAARRLHHDCRVHEDGVRVVEVEAVSVPAAVDVRSAQEGSVIVFEPHSCHMLGCENYRLCHPHGLGSKTKVKVVSVGKKIACPSGYDLVEVGLL